MAIPQSLLQQGYMTQDQVLHRTGKFLPMVIGIDGARAEGKTELGMSAPGVILGLTVDRGHLNPMLNPNPPKTRTADIVWKVIDPPLPTAAKKEEFSVYWNSIRDEGYKAMKMPEIRTLLMDGDSDTWEIQRMGSLGKLTQILPHMYTQVNAERRAYYARLTDSGKFLIFTSKMTKEYVAVNNPDGSAKIGDTGRPERRWSGRWERKTFDDIDYSLTLSIHCFRVDAVYDKDGELTSAGEFGARLDLCKPNRDLEGTEFIGVDCNLRSILEFIFPAIPLSQWGYEGTDSNSALKLRR